MSDRLTSICLPGKSVGVADYGLRTVPEMIAFIRARAVAMKAEAEAILNASDNSFRVDTYVGIHARRGLKILQQPS